MTQQVVTTIKNGKITLPKGLQKEWGTDKVVFVSDQYGVYIKPLSAPSLEAIEPKLKKLGKMVPTRLINEAVKWAKQKTYAGSA